MVAGAPAPSSITGALSRKADLILETLSGPKIHHLLDHGESSWRYRSSLGRPSFLPEEVPIRLEERLSRVVDHSLRVGDTAVTVTALSVGNPQCVVFVTDLPQDPEFRRLGSALEVHPAFPERTNVSFVQITGPRRLQVRIWERGVGPTHSSGTGCSGAAVAAIHTGKVGSPARGRNRDRRAGGGVAAGRRSSLDGTGRVRRRRALPLEGT